MEEDRVETFMLSITIVRGYVFHLAAVRYQIAPARRVAVLIELTDLTSRIHTGARETLTGTMHDVRRTHALWCCIEPSRVVALAFLFFGGNITTNSGIVDLSTTRIMARISGHGPCSGYTAMCFYRHN